jgi:hypothetical protein
VLRTFVGPDGVLRERRFVTRATGYEHDLYSLADAGPALTGSRPDAIERDVLGPIDHYGALALERLTTSSPSDLSEDERGHLARLLNSMLERHPQRIYERDLAAERIARERRDALRELLGPTPYERPDVFTLIDCEALARNIHREHLVREIQKTTSIDYLKSLTFVKFAVEPNEEIAFVTGDNSVLVNGGQSWPLHFFTLAISPNILLIGINMTEAPAIDSDELQTMLDLGRIHNLQLFMQCEYIFSKDGLRDGLFAKTRTAAQRYLKRPSWRR